jgi:hypothetical protein
MLFLPKRTQRSFAQAAPCLVLTSRQGRCLSWQGLTGRSLGKIGPRRRVNLHCFFIPATREPPFRSKRHHHSRGLRACGHLSRNALTSKPEILRLYSGRSANHLCFFLCLKSSNIRPPVSNLLSGDSGTQKMVRMVQSTAYRDDRSYIEEARIYPSMDAWPNGKALDYESRDSRFDP